MRLIAALLLTLSTAFDAAAMARPPVYIDTTCDRFAPAPASPALKTWLKNQCPIGARSPNPVCGDLEAFVRAVAKINGNLRDACPALKP